MNNDPYAPKANEVRGEVINKTATLEMFMDEYISKYFLGDGDSRMTFIHIVLAKESVTFGTKVQIFTDILKKAYGQKIYETRFPRIRKNLDDIALFRNRFAHQMTPSGLPNEWFKNHDILLLDFKGSTNIHFVSRQEVLEHLANCDKYIQVLSEVIGEIGQTPNAQR